jgi:hypothetical protein
MKDDEIDFRDIPLNRDWSTVAMPAGLQAAGKIARTTS